VAFMKLSFLELVQTGQIAHAASGATRLRDHTKAQFPAMSQCLSGEKLNQVNRM
jgi:hypothetical protein